MITCSSTYQRWADSLAKIRRFIGSPEHEAYKANVRRTEAKVRLQRANRRARLKGAGGRVTSEEWQSLVAAVEGKCFYCSNVPFKLTMDHVIPLAKGGLHTISNIVPACKSCNSSKGVGLAPRSR